MHIALIIYSLRPGGAERVASTLVNHWAMSGDPITLVTLESPERDFYPLDSRVRRIALGLDRRTNNWREFISHNLRRAYQLRRVARSTAFDLLLSFGDTT